MKSELEALQEKLDAVDGKVGHLRHDTGRELAVLIYRTEHRDRLRRMAIIWDDNDAPLPEFAELHDVFRQLLAATKQVVAERGKFCGHEVWRVWEVFDDEAERFAAEVRLWNLPPQGKA